MDNAWVQILPALPGHCHATCNNNFDPFRVSEALLVATNYEGVKLRCGKIGLGAFKAGYVLACLLIIQPYLKPFAAKGA